MKPILRSNLFAMIIIINVIFGGILLSLIFRLLRIPVGGQLVLQEVILLIIPVIIFFIITKLPIKETLKINRINPLQIVIIIGIAIFVQPLAQIIGILSQFLSRDYVGSTMANIYAFPMITKLGIIALTPAICEELVFRGVVFSGYKNVNIIKASIMTGLFFGIFHLNLEQFFYAFAMGVLLTYLVYITNSIFASITLHFVFNGLQVVMQYMASAIVAKSGTKAISSISSLPSKEVISVIVMELIIVFIFTPFAGFLIWQLKKVSEKRNRLPLKASADYSAKLWGINSFKELINWPVAVIMTLFIAFLIYLQFRV